MSVFSNPKPLADSPAETPHPLSSPRPNLTQQHIFLFWLPLAASWILMGLEMPFVNAVLARLPEAERMIAAFGIVASLSITIESPVIMLLATSTALARSPQSYRMLERFTLHLMLLVTVVHGAVSFTPLFEVVVRGWMGVPEILLEPVRLGMMLLLPWSAAIGWRRFKQGIMIRYGQTRLVGIGTMVRLASSAGVAAAVAWGTAHWPISGVVVGAVALSLGVIIEAVFAHSAIAPLIRRKLLVPPPAPDPDPLTYSALVKFHTPLAASSLLFLLTQPLVSAALARLANPTAVLAAWPITGGLLFITRSPVLALPEVIIALLTDEAANHRALRRFCLLLGSVCLGLLALLSFTPLSHLYFQNLIGVTPELADLSVMGGQVAVALPLLMALQSWYRGMLTAQRATTFITVSMAVNLITMALILALGVGVQAPGIVLAALALTLATAAETLILGWAARQPRIPSS